MNARLAADAVLVLHGVFIAFGVLGGLLALWKRGWMLLHLPALAWAAFVMMSGRICPLTPLEVRLRRQAGDAGYGGGFVDHYLAAAIYPEGLTRKVQIGLGVAVIVLNLGIYLLVFKRRSRRTVRLAGTAHVPRSNG
ncbi:DUF2784 domain-containing protein [Xylophilus ampelinus]|uniref:Uncharacterized protein DUF2784 n=1 Tax=Xylophilus ampelinus TaxID=54067 RepID=A0A318SZG2_9BURK|nr:DUF2784 domain-containing protein [Xylophilus ampelinus]MCS4509949.1 DUF2784 domain-containing protein [Xylophilus ampelinus]PYE78498.1 uncharacterized protein DUF2784 [Xylophilus ampelinus]